MAHVVNTKTLSIVICMKRLVPIDTRKHHVMDCRIPLLPLLPVYPALIAVVSTWFSDSDTTSWLAVLSVSGLEQVQFSLGWINTFSLRSFFLVDSSGHHWRRSWLFSFGRFVQWLLERVEGRVDLAIVEVTVYGTVGGRVWWYVMEWGLWGLQ